MEKINRIKSKAPYWLVVFHSDIERGIWHQLKDWNWRSNLVLHEANFTIVEDQSKFFWCIIDWWGYAATPNKQQWFWGHILSFLSDGYLSKCFYIENSICCINTPPPIAMFDPESILDTRMPQISAILSAIQHCFIASFTIIASFIARKSASVISDSIETRSDSIDTNNHASRESSHRAAWFWWSQSNQLLEADISCTQYSPGRPTTDEIYWWCPLTRLVDIGLNTACVILNNANALITHNKIFPVIFKPSNLSLQVILSDITPAQQHH